MSDKLESRPATLQVQGERGYVLRRTTHKANTHTHTHFTFPHTQTTRVKPKGGVQRSRRLFGNAGLRSAAAAAVCLIFI